jgi:hypothetical protein
MQATSSRTGSSARAHITSDAVFLYVLVCVLLMLACYLLLTIPGPFNQDFRAFYAAGQMLLHLPSHMYSLAAQEHWQDASAGGSSVLPFYHPAYEALLYAPLSLLRFHTAYLVYAVCNMLLLWVCYLVSPDGSGVFGTTGRPLLFFLSFPVLLAIFVGQNSLWMLLAFSLVYNALTRDQVRRAGVLLGLASFKLAIIGPLALLLCIRRGRRFAVAFAATSATLLGLSIVLTGPSGMADFLHLLTGATIAVDNNIAAQHTTAVLLSSMPNVAGLLYLLGSAHLPSPVPFVLNLVFTLLILGCGGWIQRRAAEERVAFSAAIVCAVLVSPHLYIYDYSALLLPLLLLSHRALKYIAVPWFLLPPALYMYAFLTWFAPAVILAFALLAVCIVEFRKEERSAGLLLGVAES